MGPPRVLSPHRDLDPHRVLGPVFLVSLLQRELVLKQKTTNNYLLYIFLITTAFIHFHCFLLDISPAVLLKFLICFFISSVSLIYSNMNNG